MISEISGGNRLSEFTPERLMYAMFNEAARCGEEEIADVKDIDMAMIAGTGMTHQGERIGPLALADRIGLDVIVEQLGSYERELGPRFHPADKLVELVKAGHTGEQARTGFLEHV